MSQAEKIRSFLLNNPGVYSPRLLVEAMTLKGFKNISRQAASRGLVEAEANGWATRIRRGLYRVRGRPR
jgi:hypothetical protein